MLSRRQLAASQLTSMGFYGILWEADPFAAISKDTLISIQANVTNEFGLLREHLGLGLVPFRLGMFSTKDTSMHSEQYLSNSIFNFLDHDVVLASYRLLREADNVLTIKDYDTSTNIISGEFNVTFVITNNCDSLNNADTLFITNGAFQALAVE